MLLDPLRIALRQLRKSPGFTAATVGILALGIGATAAMFSLVNGVLLRPLPFPEPNRLVWMSQVDTRLGPAASEALSYPDFFDWRKQQRSFSAIASYRGIGATLTGAGEPQRLDAQVVSSEFFRLLGVAPLVGHDFAPEDEQPGHHSVMLSYDLWQTAFGAAPDVAGRSITLDATPHTVAGVMPRGFRFPIQNPLPSLWISVANDTEGEHAVAKQRGFDALDVIGRLKPGVSPQQALTEVSLIARRIAENDPEADKAYNTALVEPLLGHYVDDSKPALRVLFAAVGLLLLIACANVAGLLLARATRQRSEIAVRLALGASRGRIVRQILAESVLLSTIAGAIGVVLAGGILRALLQFVPKSVPRIEQAAVDPVVLAFATLVSLATGVLFGVLPALRMSRLDPITAIREGGRGAAGARGQNRLHAILVIAEVAVGLVLLVGSGLLIRSFVAVSRTNPGFDAHNVLTASVTLPGDRYDRTHRIQFFQTLIDRLRALPGVRAVTAGFPLPLSEGRIGVSFEIEGHGESEGQSGENLGVMLPGYFVAMRIPVLQGREFTDRDTTTSPPVILIDERFAHKYFPGENPVGKHMQSKLGDGVLDKPMREIVGVVGNIKAEGLTVEPRPHYYLPFEQAVITSPPISIRTAVDPLSLVAPLRAEVARLDPQLPLYRVRTLEDLRYRAAAEPRFQTLLLSSFAAMALLLAAVGLYGVLSYMVTQRVPEIGLRIALGARRSDVMALVLRRGMGLATVGAAVGMLASLFVTGFLEKLLYGVTPLDQLTFATVTVVLLLVALVAGAAPAMRASRVDPMNALRDQ